MRGRKCLVLDDQLGGIFNLIINSNTSANPSTSTSAAAVGPDGQRDMVENSGSKFLREYGVTDVKKLHSGQASVASTTADHIVYVSRASLSNMRMIAQQIQYALKNTSNRCQFHIYYIPFHTIICEQILEDEHVLGHITTVGEFSIGLIPLDSDILSLEMPDMFKDCYVDGDTSSLNLIAQSLHKLQSLYGVIPNVKSKGSASKKILQKLLQLRKQQHDSNVMAQQQHQHLQSGSLGAAGDHGYDHTHCHDGSMAPMAASAIDTVVLLDREVDLISPLVTPLTYEGLLDELIGLDYGKIQVDARIVGDIADPPKLPDLPGMEKAASPPPPPSTTASFSPDEKITLMLNAGDPIYNDIRDTSIEKLGAYMQEKAIFIRKTYSTFRENKDATLQEIAEFVKKIPGITREYKLLHQHINLAEVLKRTTDSREFRDYWQIERGILESEEESTTLEFIEDLISADLERVEFFHVLRLLCLQSICNSGIRRNYDALKRQIVQTYGYEHIFTLYNIERAGFLKRRENKGGVSVGLGLGLDSQRDSPWSMLKKQLNLIVDNSILNSQVDISYVTAGYAPLSVRLVQAAVQSGGWGSNAASASGASDGGSSSSNLYEVMRLLPGPMLEFSQSHGVVDGNVAEAVTRQKQLLQLQSTVARGAGGSSSGAVGGGGIGTVVGAPAVGAASSVTSKRVMLVYVVGGLSCLEIAALRTLSNHPSFPFTIIMATTKLISANSMLTSLVSGGK